MPRILRHIINVAAGLSLLLCMATAILLVHSRYAMDAWNHRGPQDKAHFRNEWTIRDLRGRIWYGWQHNGGYAVLIREAHWPDFAGFHSYALEPQPLETWAMKEQHFAGFEFLSAPTLTGEAAAQAVIVPMWAIILITAVLPAAWIWRKRRRFPAGMCQSCGYDLRASPTRCPECGSLVKNLTPSSPSSRSPE